jgi:hypothetical protein
MQNDDKHIIAEKWVDEALTTPPVFKLSDNFAERVAAKAVRRFAWEQYFREFLIYLSAFLGFIAVTVALAFIFFGADWLEWKHFFVTNLSLIVSLNIIGLFILFADKVLLQYFFFKYSRKLTH